MFEKKERICRVLLAEDNPNDVKIFKRAVRKSDCRFELQVVIDGEQALDFLRRKGEWEDAWRPDFVVLNINMPKINGWEVAECMKSDPDLALLPTAMWTIASPECRDYAERAFEMGCAGGFTKPVDEERMEAQVRTMLEFYWWAWSHPRALADESLSCGR